MLCAVCILALRKGEEVVPHHKYSTDLKKAAEAGCRICMQLEPVFIHKSHDTKSDGKKLYILGDVDNQQIIRKVLSRSFTVLYMLFHRFVIYGPSEMVKFDISPLLEDEESLSKHPDFFDQAREAISAKHPWQVFGDETELQFPSSTGDAKVMELVQLWLKTCREEHSWFGTCQEKHSCCPCPPSDWHPKRLIDARTTKLSLVESRKNSPQDPYAALSHCWGPRGSERSKLFKLTTNNLPQILREGIDKKDLPQSFKDALEVCVAIGINYLWIDSLCIVQDDEDDWNEHARTMAQIYENCELNIAIDHASNPDNGAFVHRDIRRLQPCCTLVNHPGLFGGVGCCYIHGPIDSLLSLDELPLSKRAWVFQERLLSPKILHFGADRIFWECNRSVCSEIPRPDYRSNVPSRTPFSVDPWLSFYHDGPGNDWNSLVEAYTARNLTYPEKDKLVAIGSVAQEVEKRNSDRYLAGLFEKDLPQALLWHPRLHQAKGFDLFIPGDGHLPKRKRIDGCTPSWSWASIDGLCAFSVGCSEQKPLATIIGVDVKHIDEKNPYGQVKSGIMTIKGRVVDCYWDKNSEQLAGYTKIQIRGITLSNGTQANQRFPKQKTGCSYRILEVARRMFRKPLVGSSTQASGFGLFDVDDDPNISSTRKKVMMQITESAGLLLVKHEKEEAYERVGKFLMPLDDPKREFDLRSVPEQEIKII